MKKMFFLILFFLVLFGSTTVSYACSGCTSVTTAPHRECTAKIYVSSNDTQHTIWCCCGTQYTALDKKNHNWSWSSSSHTQSCNDCSKSLSHSANFKYYDSSKEICDYGGCLVKRDHDKSSYKDGGTYHYKTCSRSRCSGYKFSKGDHTGGTATCTAKAKCSTCNFEYGSLASHVGSSWSNSNEKHVKICVNCKTTIAEHNPSFKYSSTTQEKCSECDLTQDHSLSGYKDGGTYHYKTCSRCSGYTFSKGDHTGGSQTCTQGAVCSTCTVTYKAALGHTGGSAECEGTGKKAVCTRCSFSYGNLVDHNYSISCTEKHCDSYLCKWCKAHKGSCNKCDSNWCSHCQFNYCSKCGHVCQHNTDGRCPTQNPHCIKANVKFCSLCNNHVHVGCNTNGKCTEPHCNKIICSVCKVHECGGPHNFEIWETDDANKVKQTHSKRCNVGNCTVVGETHDSMWAKADTEHKSVCSLCNTLTYIHTPNWEKGYKDKGVAHKCNGITSAGCEAIHTATTFWGSYYKVSEERHTRDCNYENCELKETVHDNITAEPWIWHNETNHIRTCPVENCGLTQELPHDFNKVSPKEANDKHDELYKHWLVCKTCDPDLKQGERNRVDGLHSDTRDYDGKCDDCGQILWKAIDANGEIIPIEQLTDPKEAKKRKAVQEEVIKIIEVIDIDGTRTEQYIQRLTGAANVIASSNELKITVNGEYTFDLGRGGSAKIIIANISQDILIDKIVQPITSTKDGVKITLRANKSEAMFNKKIFIKNVTKEAIDNKTADITDSELERGSNTFSITYPDGDVKITQNGTYYFWAEDTAGNNKQIEVVIDNIIKGQATVAISSDVFRRGYIFTEILINPNTTWEKTGSPEEIIKAWSYKAESSTSGGTELKKENIKIVKVMDMQRKEVVEEPYSPGYYYVQVALGGSIFEDAGTYIIDLTNVKLTNDLNLSGQNRIIVEVQDLKDLT